MGNLCSLYPTIFNMTCVSLSKENQKATGLTYHCEGNCSSAGFTKNSNGACEGEFNWTFSYEAFLFCQFNLFFKM